MFAPVRRDLLWSRHLRSKSGSFATFAAIHRAARQQDPQRCRPHPPGFQELRPQNNLGIASNFSLLVAFIRSVKPMRRIVLTCDALCSFGDSVCQNRALLQGRYSKPVRKREKRAASAGETLRPYMARTPCGLGALGACPTITQHCTARCLSPGGAEFPVQMR
jgi:hypothetical protein